MTPLRPAERLLFVLSFLALWPAAAAVAGGPLFSDDVFYLRLSLEPVPEAFVLNRYSHVYLQRLMLLPFEPPLLGVRVFWGFTAAGSAVLAALAARMLPGGTSAGAALALLLFALNPVLLRYSGATFSDFTAMLVTAAATVVWLAALRADGPRKARLEILFGLLAYLAFRSKESGGCVAVLLLGLGLLEGRIRGTRLWQASLRAAAGAALGVLLFVLLDGALLGDPWFSLSFGSMRTHFAFNFLKNDAVARPTESWLLPLAGGELLGHAVLFLVAALRPGGSAALRVLLLLPLAVLGLLEIVMLRARVPVTSPFYLAPLYPALCSVAGSLLDRPALEALRGKTPRTHVLAAAALALAAAGGLFVLGATGPLAWETGPIARLALLPLAALLVFAAHACFGLDDARARGVTLALLPALLLTPALAAATLVAGGETRRRFEHRVFPWTAFPDLPAGRGARLLVSSALSEDFAMLGKNEEIARTLLTLVRGRAAGQATLEVADLAPRAAAAAVLERGYDALLLTEEEARRVLRLAPEGHLYRLQSAAAPLPRRVAVVALLVRARGRP